VMSRRYSVLNQTPIHLRNVYLHLANIFRSLVRAVISRARVMCVESCTPSVRPPESTTK
jgi:hypothetical protein